MAKRVQKPKRSEVWWINFDPAQGSEVRKRRPAIVVSNDMSNRYLDRVQVVPLTSNVQHVYPSECIVTVKKQECKAMADQIRTVSIARCSGKLGKLVDAELAALEQVLKIQLGLL